MQQQINQATPRSDMKSSIKLILPLAIFATSIAHAELVGKEDIPLSGSDIPGSLRLLENAAAAGNVAAKGKLAEYLRGLPPPYRNIDRSCTLAHEAADAGDLMGTLVRVECLITGGEKADEPIPLARQLARQVQAKGSPAGGFVLYEVFVLDPKYSYSPGGKVDMDRYNALAATPVAQRGEQIDALNGLSAAVSAGHVRAVATILGYLSTTVAPGNLDRMINIASGMQQSKMPIPAAVAGDVQLARQIRQIGASRTSVSTFKSAYSSALIAAAFQIRGIRNDACDAKDIKIVHVDASEPIANAVYLPLVQPLQNSYLVQGSWSESWTFAGCDKTAAVKMQFTADGWGGAQYTSSPIKLP